MRKFTLTLALVLSMALILANPVPASAVTPKLKVPDMPEIPDITGSVQENVRATISYDFWDKRFSEHPIRLPIRWP